MSRPTMLTLRRKRAALALVMGVSLSACASGGVEFSGSVYTSSGVGYFNDPWAWGPCCSGPPVLGPPLHARPRPLPAPVPRMPR